MTQTMDKLQKMEEKDHTILMRILFGLESPTPVIRDLQNAESITFFDTTLNDSQEDAVRFALSSQEIALIHGPPGVCTLIPSSPRSKLMYFRQVKPIP